MLISKLNLFLTVVLVSLVIFAFWFRVEQRNVLSATKVATPSVVATNASYIRINCDYFQASWIQFKRDFNEVESKNYPSTESAQSALEDYLKIYQNEASTKGCPPPHY